jgi:hypothetical protein
MTGIKRKTGIQVPGQIDRLGAKFCALIMVMACVPVLVCPAVTSKVTRHSSNQDFLKGEVNDVVIGSRGTIQLGRRAEVLVEQFDDVWSINSIVVIGDMVYVGTSPNGGVYAFGTGGLKKIYSAVQEDTSSRLPDGRERQTGKTPDSAGADANKTEDANAVKTEEHLANEHIFALAKDISGRLLVAISGQRCALCRLEAGKLKTIFEPSDANYIFAIAVDQGGDIYLGTGPQGKVYRLDSLGKKPELVVNNPDKNILSLTPGPDGLLYAGSDTRGLIYRINTKTREAKVLYDSEQEEITAVLFSGELLYAAATSAQVVRAEAKFAAQPPQPGRPEQQPEEEPPDDDSGGGTKLQIANTKKQPEEKPPERKRTLLRPPKPTRASFVYRITKDGFVTDIFKEAAVFFCLEAWDKELLVGTGNDARLFSVEPVSEEEAIIYEDRQASQITALAASGDNVYVGSANPARLVKLSRTFAREGIYTSELVDAGQPAKWGKFQTEADVPSGSQILMACRSGNVKDVNDPSFSDWTELREVTGPVQLDCPAGRFCQYKLVFRGGDGLASPVIREVAVASTVPNLAPRVESVSTARTDARGKEGVFRISYNVKDDNGDELIYKIDFRKVGRTGWIEIEDELDARKFEWDSRTVEDGRYEIRVTASDERSNTPQTKMTGSRVSEVVTVDNTGPVIKRHKIEKAAKGIKLTMTVTDELSAVGKVDYTIDSDANWLGVVPDDLVYDTTSEDFTIVADKQSAGQHVIALRLADDVGNMTYKTFDFTVEEQ